VRTRGTSTIGENVGVEDKRNCHAVTPTFAQRRDSNLLSYFARTRISIKLQRLDIGWNLATEPAPIGGPAPPLKLRILFFHPHPTQLSHLIYRQRTGCNKNARAGVIVNIFINSHPIATTRQSYPLGNASTDLPDIQHHPISQNA
jgi:hypothetical protein